MKVAATAKKESEGLEPGVVPTPIEKQFALQVYDPVANLLTDYASLVIQFGYLTLFVATFPLAPLMCYVSNYISIRIGKQNVIIKYCGRAFIFIYFFYSLHIHQMHGRCARSIAVRNQLLLKISERGAICWK